MNLPNIENLGYVERTIRVLVGFAMIFSVTLIEGPIGIAAVLPLIAVYPILTGFIGWDPLVTLLSKISFHKKRSVDQLALR